MNGGFEKEKKLLDNEITIKVNIHLKVLHTSQVLWITFNDIFLCVRDCG